MKDFLIFTKYYMSYCFWRSVDNTANVKDVLSTLIGEYGHHYLPNPLFIIHVALTVIWLIISFPFFFINTFFMKLVKMHNELNELDDLLRSASADMIHEVIGKFERVLIQKGDDMYTIDVEHAKTMMKHCMKELANR